MSYKEYVAPFDTREQAYQALLSRLKVWKKVRGHRIMKVEQYKERWWIVIIEE